MFAAANGDKLALERAFLSGIDMNMGDYDQRTALHLACSENHLECVKFLVQTCKVDIEVKDRWGNSPLQDALRTNNTRIVALLKAEVSQRLRSMDSNTDAITEGDENEKESSDQEQPEEDVVGGQLESFTSQKKSEPNLENSPIPAVHLTHWEARNW